MAVNLLSTNRYYRMDSTVPFEEDNRHEFKAHMNICREEIPHWVYESSGGQSRAAVSKAICAFLNGEQGGTIYCGVLDTGLVQGLPKTQYQMDHIKLALEDVLQRYTPPVAPGRVSLCFVPVIDADCRDEDVQNFLSRGQYVDAERRQQPHQLREGSHKCWCVRDAKAQLANNSEQPLYVVEIIVHPWEREGRGAAWGGVGEMRAPPIHQEENGHAYTRRQATVQMLQVTEVHRVAEQMVHRHYKPLIRDLKEELYKLRQLAAAKQREKQISSD